MKNSAARCVLQVLLDCEAAPEAPKRVDSFESAESGLTATTSFDSSMLDKDV